MTNYRLYCFDREGAIVCRDDFEADNNVEARGIASAICDACSDEHHRYELWKDDLPIESGQTLTAVLQVGGLSAKAQQTVLDHEIALRNSYWRAGQSRKLSVRLQAWAFSQPTHLSA
jgi:hypothetical protein